MDQSIEVTFKPQPNKSLLFLKQNQTQELGLLNQINEGSDEINDSKNIFQNKDCQPQLQHQGDQDISCSSFYVELNHIHQASQNDINTSNKLFNKMKLELSTQQTQNNYCDEKNDISNIQSQSNNKLVQEEEIKINLNVKQNNSSGVLLNEKQVIKENSPFKNNSEVNGFKQDLQGYSNTLFTKNTIIKSESKNQSSQNDCQSKMQKGSQMKMNSQILIQDDIFYENDNKKLGNKVNFALKSQYKQQQEQNNTTAYKQNLQKAANIIGRLLNSSMNRVMRIRQNVTNFNVFLKVRYSNRRIENLSDQEFLSINDLSYFHSQKEQLYLGGKVVKILLYIIKYAKVFPIFMPSNTIRVIWDLIQVMFIYFFLYIYSLLIFFDSNYFENQFIHKFNSTALALFIVDIVVNLNTAFFDKDMIITKRILIAQNYFFSSIFVTDFIGISILGSKIIYSKYILHQLNENFFVFGLNLLIFLKINGISSKKKRFDYIFTLTENQKHICKLINQLASVIAVAHIAAIGWYFVGVQEMHSNRNNWLEKIDVQSNSIYDQYIFAIYWSITTMTTGYYFKFFSSNFKIYFLKMIVGYGDISATNSIEAIYISITMILFSCVFAYSINNIGFILQEIEKSSKQLNDDLVTIQRYLIRKNVSIQLKSRVRHYLSFLAKEQKDRDKSQEEKILYQLSNKLRDEITLEINSKILNNNHLFSSNFSKSTINKLIFIMKEILVNPNEIIISEDRYDDSSIYFIQDGIIEIYQQQIQKQGQITVINTLSKGQIFGDISFFTGLQRQASVRSVNLSTLYKIKRDEFLEILKENKEDFERFKMIQDQIIFQKGKSMIHNDCYYCKDSSHIASQCPRTHKLFDKQFITLKYNFSMFQERQNQERNTKIKLNSKKSIKKNKDIILCLRQNLQIQDSEILSLYNDNKFNSDDNNSQTDIEEDDEDDGDEDEDDDTISQIDDQSVEKQPNQKKNIRNQEQDKQSKNQQSADKNGSEETSQQNNENIQCNYNLNQDNQELNKATSRSIRSQTKLKSVELSEALEQINQEAINALNKQSSCQESYQVQKKDIDSICQKNIQQGDSLKNKVKKSQSGHNKIKKHSIQSIQIDDLINNENNQVQVNSKQEIYKESSMCDRSSQNKICDRAPQNKKNSFLNSENLLIQTHKEKRCSLEQSVQNLSNLKFLQGKNISQTQINNGNHYQQDNSVNNIGSHTSLKDHNESISNSLLPKNNRQSLVKNYQKESSQEKIQVQQSNNVFNKKDSLNQEIKMIERFSRILQNSQLPLILQLTNSKTDPLFLSNPIDYFDKISFFKKFYPDYNFDKVLIKLKTQQNEKKKLRKMATKERRQNIGLRRVSIFQVNSTFSKVPKDYDINEYKPTYLSYGIKMQQGVIYPLNNFSLKNN